MHCKHAFAVPSTPCFLGFLRWEQQMYCEGSLILLVVHKTFPKMSWARMLVSVVYLCIKLLCTCVSNCCVLVYQIVYVQAYKLAPTLTINHTLSMIKYDVAGAHREQSRPTKRRLQSASSCVVSLLKPAVAALVMRACCISGIIVPGRMLHLITKQSTS